MMFKNQAIWKGVGTLTKAGLVLSLLFLYVLGSVEVDSLHSLSHEHENSQLHAAENEADACHQTVYHNQGKGCEHPVHVSKNDTCSLCDGQLHTAHILLITNYDADALALASPFGREETLSSESALSYLSGRAPPVL